MGSAFPSMTSLCMNILCLFFGHSVNANKALEKERSEPRTDDVLLKMFAEKFNESDKLASKWWTLHADGFWRQAARVRYIISSPEPLSNFQPISWRLAHRCFKRNCHTTACSVILRRRIRVSYFEYIPCVLFNRDVHNALWCEVHTFRQLPIC